jgi:hypothetical protein
MAAQLIDLPAANEAAVCLELGRFMGLANALTVPNLGRDTGVFGSFEACTGIGAILPRKGRANRRTSDVVGAARPQFSRGRVATHYITTLPLSLSVADDK